MQSWKQRWWASVDWTCTDEEIARAGGIQPETVRRRRRALRESREGQRWTIEETQRALAMMDEGMLWRDIAHELGRSIGAVCTRLERCRAARNKHAKQRRRDAVKNIARLL